MSDKRRYSDLDQRNNSNSSLYTPPYSRLFIVCNKSVTEDTLRNEFGKYGTIEELRCVKDRQTGEPKGNAFYSFTF